MCVCDNVVCWNLCWSLCVGELMMCECEKRCLRVCVCVCDRVCACVKELCVQSVRERDACATKLRVKELCVEVCVKEVCVCVRV